MLSKDACFQNRQTSLIDSEDEDYLSATNTNKNCGQNEANRMDLILDILFCQQETLFFFGNQTVFLFVL